MYCVCAKFGQLILKKLLIKLLPLMSDFKAKCTKIQFRLGLRCSPCWVSLQRFPDTLAGFKGPTSKGRKGQESKRKGNGGEKREREGREEKREEEVR